MLRVVEAKPAFRSPSFAVFDSRARQGDALNVIFFGASLTWGANASDPQQTSYRADIARRFEAAYPRAHFHFRDAAIGGTGSHLAVYRLDRDVLRHKPDLIFLDFTANDDIYSNDPDTLAAYESLVRRLIADAKVPVVQVVFPFQWNTAPGEMAKMKGRAAHLGVSKAYNTAVGDAVALATERIAAGQVKVGQLWPIDGVHPGDEGYALFAEAAWAGYRDGVNRKLVCRVPEHTLYGDNYLSKVRIRISQLGPLPTGWQTGIPNRVSAWYDGLMSRWLDDEVIAGNRDKARGAVMVEPLRLKFRGTSVLLFGEETLKSGKYAVSIDGKAVRRPGAKAGEAGLFDASSVQMGGNKQHAPLLAKGLQPNVEHTLEIAPQFLPDAEQELRLESVCVAGPGAAVYR